ncbi:type II toxin-antitoxin system RelE/ParE family toxin [Psychroflexus sp. CAK57W]|nr:type II toxin-antitoxin system RelE/ParE family toxin [Psychroflexus curvus]MBZ9787704.1 type II toxin-antitoxin system RelE/ParE family toxin [Psychroflexus curvus]
MLYDFFHRNRSVTYSLKLLDETEDLMNTLSKNEFIGRLTSNKITRVISMKAYLIFYEIRNDTIEIVSFWDNRQNQKNKI